MKYGPKGAGGGPLDWWYDDGEGLIDEKDTGGDDEDDEPERDWGHHHDEKQGTTRAEWVAHNLLKESAKLFCPVTKHEENRLEQMTNPEVYVERSVVFVDRGLDDDAGASADELEGRVMYADHRRYRVSERSGHISGPLIGDQPKAEFLDVVDQVLDYAQADVRYSLREQTASRIRSLACAYKSAQSRRKPDVKIMEEVVRCIDDPDRLDGLGF
ncbi:hypothetical protein [Haloferax sulfurifontis]|uniref:Uncharacterized protein n=2 Tax=Haloferax sulfurifontis TaxID=255616 RepID=M0IMB9_9EURY|nr:hypothetical protein [Haloferax sulfurifontis]ELZ96599.1 hypothetical protein C441_04504 [Haloferax sulfurifontis ATCC BAA-897]GGC72569.1 hypothetical protein GCM10007209_38150 [Haloferax sulfurifontis]